MATQVMEPKSKTIADALQQMKPQIKMALPKGMDADHFVRIVLTLLQKTPSLRDCTPNSILLGVSQAAELGLELGTALGHAYLVPYKGVAQLQIGWRGFIELARRSGLVRGIAAEVVYEHDSFLIEKGLDPKLVHKPKLSGERGEAIGAYAVATFKDGYRDFEWMDLSQIEHCRKSSRATREDSPWNTHWEEMARKTPIRRLCKRLPLSPEDAVIIRAAILDEYHDAGIEVGALELEPDSPMAAPKAQIPPYVGATEQLEAVSDRTEPQPQTPGNGPQTRQHGMPPAAPAGSFAVHFYVGKMLTFISGNIRPLEGEFKKLGGRPSTEKKGQWTIPGSLTDDLLKACEELNIPAVEVNEDGTPIQHGELFDAR